MSPEVSVITIFLDARRYLAEAIKSMLAQSFSAWELLLVDDGSTDGSSELARDYAVRYPDLILYLEHPQHINRGMSASRNLGVSHARGELVAFLDADDVWLPEKLQRQVDMARNHPQAAMVYGPADVFHDGPTERRPSYIQSLGVPLDSLIPPPELFEVFIKDSGTTPSPSGVIVRREALLTVGGFTESFRGMFEDQVAWAKLTLRYPVFCYSECLYQYRQHPDACCTQASHSGRLVQDDVVFSAWLLDYVEDSSPEVVHRVRPLVERRLYESLWKCARLNSPKSDRRPVSWLWRRAVYLRMMLSAIRERPRLLGGWGAVRFLRSLASPFKPSYRWSGG